MTELEAGCEQSVSARMGACIVYQPCQAPSPAQQAPFPAVVSVPSNGSGHAGVCGQC
jgi:hypothetical protein